MDLFRVKLVLHFGSPLFIQEIEVLYSVNVQSTFLHRPIFQHVLADFFFRQAVIMVAAVNLDHLIVFWQVEIDRNDSGLDFDLILYLLAVEIISYDLTDETFKAFSVLLLVPHAVEEWFFVRRVMLFYVRYQGRNLNLFRQRRCFQLYRRENLK